MVDTPPDKLQEVVAKTTGDALTRVVAKLPVKTEADPLAEVLVSRHTVPNEIGGFGYMEATSVGRECYQHAKRYKGRNTGGHAD